MFNLERMRDPANRWLLGLAVCLLFSAMLAYFQGGERLSRKLLDRQFNLLHEHAMRPLQKEVVIVGIDEGSFRQFQEPFALWHPHLSRFLQAMKISRPSVVGLDIDLPERSYQFLLPRYEEGLLTALRELSVQTPVVLARRPAPEGRLRTVFAPLASAVADAPASVTLCVDVDGVVRRFDPNLCTVNAQGSTFAEVIAARLGVESPGVGLVDFSAGRKIDYIPFQHVLEWQAQRNEKRLAEAFAGKVVLLGIVSSRADKVRAPVPMAMWSPMDGNVPEVLMQAQVIRSMTGQGLIRQIPVWGSLLITLSAALFWLGRTNWIKLVLLAVLPLSLWGLSTWMLSEGVYVPLGDVLLAGAFAFLLRLAYEALQQMRSRNGLRALFKSNVNRDVLDGIVKGKMDSSLNADRVRVCLLHARIKDFNAWLANGTPQATVALLNDYFSEMSLAVHQQQGTLDKFSGGELQAFFGAPQLLESPERSALEAAQEMLLRLRDVNGRAREKGLPVIEMEIVLHVGQVLVGHVGATNRKEYTALGAEVDRAKAMLEFSKSEGFPVICSAAVAGAVRNAGGITEVGERIVEGEPVHLYGWNPALPGKQ